ncbi:chromosomal protein MC1 [Methanocella sp. CWC-04]|uniref:Chromosomal protein MC1 n=1 Tax=Methanooceanicella nereidis TaxID=2052831 RepID=A0AAP2R9F9_9EURY|nr:non-histone chromosomal MC1 family protein [Methanocella sp. CWC-04]MCD1293463.1 chromosomal protein MC1 [Methanocella sp. CWC-04]
MVTREKKNYGLLNEKGEEIGTFTGAQPRDAALKVAGRGVKKIILREKGTKKLHFFIGERKNVPRPANSPSWLPEKIWKSNVKKVGIKHMEYNELARNEKEIFKFPKE